MKRSALLLIAVLALAGLLAGCAEMPVAQQSTQPKKAAIGDIVGMKAAYLDSEMESRGFKNVDSYKSGDTSFTTWWNASTEQCFSVATRDGRVDELESIDKGECKGSAKAFQKDAQTQKVNLDDMVGMKASYLDSDMESRGFKNVDGYKSGDTSFTTWWNASTEQCFSVATRDGRVDKLQSVDTDECTHSAKASQRDAQATRVNLNDLLGMKAAFLDSEMESRGFKNVASHKTDDASVTTWWNASTKQCVSVGTRQGRVDTLKSISESNCQ